MARVVCLCGASGSGKSMLSQAYVKADKGRFYLPTTTAEIRNQFNNPDYDYLCSPEGNQTMLHYQDAIANNLWRQLGEAIRLVETHKHHTVILDRSPLDAYLYEALYLQISKQPLIFNDKSVRPGQWAVGRLLKELSYQNITSEVLFVGLTSLFPTDDPKRPPQHFNQRHMFEIKHVFDTLDEHKYEMLHFKQLPNSRLDMFGRVQLLTDLI